MSITVLEKNFKRFDELIKTMATITLVFFNIFLHLSEVLLTTCYHLDSDYNGSEKKNTLLSKII